MSGARRFLRDRRAQAGVDYSLLAALLALLLLGAFGPLAARIEAAYADLRQDFVAATGALQAASSAACAGPGAAAHDARNAASGAGAARCPGR
ncbi:hypothetical protein N1F89_01250 [Aquibium sp. A9E412]|uniref:hypothetical protein n=1 Tax=Aquibium sp. A9E412 TaxID=2976767 RepID=UPI0025B2126F|nr:hypothetical protein [Aquibium sp. A9E412]MDN2564836.1 hypothetical protein [Aquibium sp. A9E412]